MLLVGNELLRRIDHSILVNLDTGDKAIEYSFRMKNKAKT